MANLGPELRKLATIYKRRRVAEKKVDEIRRQENEQKELLVAKLKDAKLDRVANATASLSLKDHLYAQVTDWPKFHAWVVKHKAPEMLQRRVNVEAFRERYEAKVKVAGVSGITKSVATLSVKK